MNLKAAILSASKKVEPIEMPEWGCTVYVRRMTAGEREVFMAASQADKDSMAGIRLLVTLTMCDEGGKRLFDNPDELKDVEALALDRVSAAAMNISGLTKAAQDEIEKK